jgi:hypothetical protein
MASAMEKRCILDVLRCRYRSARRRHKTAIITELCERLLIGRKHAIRLLGPNPPGRPANPCKLGRPGKYRDAEFIGALRIVWKTMRYVCGRLMKEAIPEWLPFIEAERGKFSLDVRSRLLSISAPTIDRILKPYKATKGKTFTRSTGFRDEIPIQENIWDIRIPGFMESDTVAHCGGSMHGEFVNTLTMVDVCSMWTEARALFGRGSNAVFDALKDIEAHLPFPILGYDADNGGEVLNHHVLSYFQAERIEQQRHPVQVTRSREYRKNDNAHVEQRNDSVARRYLGYDRLGFPDLVPLINYYYAKVVCPLINHFMPSFKLKDKIRIKSRTRRVYGKPVTPYARIVASQEVHPELKARLVAEHRELNPVALVREEQVLRKLIDSASRALAEGLQMPTHPAYTLSTLYLRQTQNGVQFSEVSIPLVLHRRVHPHNLR